MLAGILIIGVHRPVFGLSLLPYRHSPARGLYELHMGWGLESVLVLPVQQNTASYLCRAVFPVGAGWAGHPEITLI